MSTFYLSNNHWRIERFKERITTKQWREVLLRDGDKIIFNGLLRQLKATRLGAGVLEISKVPLKENTP